MRKQKHPEVWIGDNNTLIIVYPEKEGIEYFNLRRQKWIWSDAVSRETLARYDWWERVGELK